MESYWNKCENQEISKINKYGMLIIIQKLNKSQFYKNKAKLLRNNKKKRNLLSLKMR